MENLSAVINKQEYSREFIYDDVAVLNASFSSFVVDIRGRKVAENRINAAIDRQLDKFIYDNEYHLFVEAVRAYKEAVANDYPVRAFESQLVYTVTLNQNGLLSFYRDNYSYTGGAHGITLRKASTFALKTGATLSLDSFFPPNFNYVQYLINEMISLANQTPEIYFDDYAKLIVKHFNPKNFYLTPQGINIFYQQYEIAPYSTGIVVFCIPYMSK